MRAKSIWRDSLYNLTNPCHIFLTQIEDIHLARSEETGKSRGFAFVKYEDSRSCVLAVDNFVGVKVLGRPIRVDHVENYRLPKKLLEQEEQKTANISAGHAYNDSELANQYNIQNGQDLFAPVARGDERDSNSVEERKDRSESRRHHKHKRKQDKKHRDSSEKSDRKKRRKESDHSERKHRRRHRRHHRDREDSESDRGDVGREEKRRRNSKD